MTRALVVVASVLLAAATVAGYGWRVAFDSDEFADRATATLRDERVRTQLADKVTDELILVRHSELLAARPLLSSVVSGVVGSDAFAGLFRRGVRDAHAGALRGDQDTITLTLVDVAVVAAAALRAVDPQLADTIERDERLALARSKLGDDFRLAHRLRVLAFVLAGLAVAAAAAAVWRSRDRRRTVALLGFGAVAAGVAIVAALTIGRALVGDSPVVAAAWDAFLADLRTIGWVLAATGAVVAAVARQPLHAELRPQLRGPLFVVAGLAIVLAPQTALTIAATLVGLYLIYRGVGDVLRLAGAAARLVIAPVAVTLVVAFAVAALVARGDADAPAVAARTGCNGHEALCERRLPDIALAATHNAMSAPERGWFSSLQERPIARQLEDGIRALLLDTHYADRLENGRIRTYFGEDGPERAIGQDGVSDDSVEAALRLRERAGFRGEGERGIYLCHTFCELGATPLGDVLDDIHAFLVTHPADVLVIVNQDYVTPEDFVAAVREAGLERLVFTPPADGRWPTLREMIDRDQRLIVLAENRAGAAPWYQPAYERLVQETPFTFKTTEALTNPRTLAATCAPNRGTDTAPLLLLNHWVNTDPAPQPPNAEVVNALEPLLARARTCRRVRGQLPNLVAVDFYTRGDVFAVVDALNGT